MDTARTECFEILLKHLCTIALTGLQSAPLPKSMNHYFTDAPVHILSGSIQLMSLYDIWFTSTLRDLPPALHCGLHFPSFKNRTGKVGSNEVGRVKVLRSMCKVLLLVWFPSQRKDYFCSTKCPCIIYSKDFWPNVMPIADIVPLLPSLPRKLGESKQQFFKSWDIKTYIRIKTLRDFV